MALITVEFFMGLPIRAPPFTSTRLEHTYISGFGDLLPRRDNKPWSKLDTMRF